VDRLTNGPRNAKGAFGFIATDDIPVSRISGLNGIAIQGREVHTGQFEAAVRRNPIVKSRRSWLLGTGKEHEISKALRYFSTHC